MNKICFLMLLTANTLYATGFYKPGDTLYVWAFSGLTLRESPSVTSKKLSAIPYGTALVVQNYSGDHSTKVEAIAAFKSGDESSPGLMLEGDLAQVTFKGKTGYVFDGYLSKLPAFGYVSNPDNEEPVFESVTDWASRRFGLLKKTQQGEMTYGLSWCVKWIFGNGVCFDSGGEKGVFTRIILPDISMEEAFLIFNYTYRYEWDIKRYAKESTGNFFQFKRGGQYLFYFYGPTCEYTIQFFPTQNLAVCTCSCAC